MIAKALFISPGISSGARRLPNNIPLHSEMKRPEHDAPAF
jgi:hypothetical protein